MYKQLNFGFCQNKPEQYLKYSKIRFIYIWFKVTLMFQEEISKRLLLYPKLVY